MEIVVGSWHQERISLADRFLRSRVQITSIAYKIDPSRECILYETGANEFVLAMNARRTHEVAAQRIGAKGLQNEPRR
jgi:hypothetical protein